MNLDVVFSQHTELHNLLDVLECDVEWKVGESAAASKQSNLSTKNSINNRYFLHLSVKLTESFPALQL